MSRNRFLFRKRKGVTPIVGTIIMTGLVLTLALSAMTFLQGQQSAIGDEIQDSLDNDVEIEQTICNGKQITFRIANNGNEELSADRAEITVFEGANVNYSFGSPTVLFEGGFRQPGTAGYLNVSTDAVFRSGERYSFQLDFGDGSVDQQCVGGQEWWHLDWEYRRQVVVTNTEDVVKDDVVAAVQFNTTKAIATGRMNPDCSDIRVVEDGRVREYDVGSCDEPGDLSEITFVTDVNRSETEYDTYLYYGNLRAEDEATNLGDPGGGVATRLEPEEEQ